MADTKDAYFAREAEARRISAILANGTREIKSGHRERLTPESGKGKSAVEVPLRPRKIQILRQRRTKLESKNRGKFPDLLPSRTSQV